MKLVPLLGCVSLEQPCKWDESDSDELVTSHCIVVEHHDWKNGLLVEVGHVDVEALIPNWIQGFVDDLGLVGALSMHNQSERILFIKEGKEGLIFGIEKSKLFLEKKKSCFTLFPLRSAAIKFLA